MAPSVILVFSGKRKSGKDYITDLLRHRLGLDRVSVFMLSGPLKHQYAKENQLDYQRLLDASDYKEKYRIDMIQWGEEKRNQDPGFFCRLATSQPGSEKPVWFISDARRETDMKWFLEQYPDRVLTVRVIANEATRKQRGWMFTAGVDDAESECGLDGGNFDINITNNGHNQQLEESLKMLETLVNDRIKSAS